MKGSDEATARLIVAPGEDPPPWLVAALGRARLTLASTIRHERAYPGRKELRQRLEVLAAASEFVRREMLDLDIAMLLRGRDGVLLNEPETYQGLGDLAERAKRRFVEVPEGQGRHKHFPRSEGATPQQNCALMISVLWEKVHTEAPPNTNANAQEACAKLWEAAGGRVKRRRRKITVPSDDATTDIWRDHLREAKLRVGSEEANFFRWSLVSGPAETEPVAEKRDDRPRLRDCYKMKGEDKSGFPPDNGLERERKSEGEEKGSASDKKDASPLDKQDGAER